MKGEADFASFREGSCFLSTLWSHLEGSFKNVRVIFICDEADLMVVAFGGTSVFVWLVKKAAQSVLGSKATLLRFFQRSVLPESNTKNWGTFMLFQNFL